MKAVNTIHYLLHHEIDKSKWDACIEAVPNGLIYGYSCYLDAMARHWDALVLGNYEAVMPLTWNKKFGFYYLYQPAFMASLGVFGKNMNQELVTDFINAIPAKFRFIEISLNAGNRFPAFPPLGFLRTNYILDLNKPYTEIGKAYRENHKRNISRAQQSGCTLMKNISVDDILRLNRESLKGISNEKDEDYANFKKLYDNLKSRGQAMSYAVINKSNRILASCVFFFSHNRAYYILAGNHPDGKTVGASHALIDAFIREHAGQHLILDFEGSDINSLAFFYSGFGAKEELYPFLKINRLPFFIRWVKK